MSYDPLPRDRALGSSCAAGAAARTGGSSSMTSGSVDLEGEAGECRRPPKDLGYSRIDGLSCARVVVVPLPPGLAHDSVGLVVDLTEQGATAVAFADRDVHVDSACVGACRNL